ncbi:MAG: efflux RND transporter periplasmic adaptor subunit [Myxococcales bacterium]|nr:efflux RND transporter periplasmic adaptor subunit [Myxococcales bacterium]
MVARKFVAFLVATSLAGAACARAKPQEDGKAAPAPSASTHADEPEHEEFPKKVRLDPDAARDAGIKVAPVTRERLVPTVSLPGEVAADPDRIAKVSSPIAGRIERVLFKEGGVVKKGEVLAVLRVPDLGKIRGAFASTGAKAKAARASAERLKELAASQLASQQAYLDAKAEAESLEALTKALGDELAALGAGSGEGGPFLLSLRAPLAGVVIARDAVVGQPVDAERVLATVADLSEVWFLGRVFEKDLGRLHQSAKADVQLNAFPKESFEGTLEYIGQQIDPFARTVIARVRVSNPKGRLRLGLFGAAQVEIQEATDAAPVLVVPRSALMDVAGKTVVFVLHDDGDYELHEVVVGASAPGKVQIVSGLREGERVVVEGAFTLKSVVLKGTMKDED